MLFINESKTKEEVIAMSNGPNETDEAFDDQEDYEEIVEIDEDGNVYKPGSAPRSFGSRKPTILRDPKGEYGRCEKWQISRSIES